MPNRMQPTPPLLMPTPPSPLASKGTTRPPLERILQIHQAIQKGEYPTTDQLALLIEVSRKTISRDMAFMRDRWRLPIDYDYRRRGFYYTKPVAHFPTLEITEGEMLALFVAQKALEQYRGTPFEIPLKTAFKRLSSGLPESVSLPWSDVNAAFSFRGTGTTTLDLPLFQLLSDAVINSKELAFEYSKLGQAGFEPRLVQPYHLASIDNQWYLFSFDLQRQQRRTFALPRIRSPRLTGETFLRPTDFDITAELEGSFGVFRQPGAERERFFIRLQFSPFAARLVAERLWHPSQKIVPLPQEKGEGIVLSLELENLEEITRWILSWGAHVRVLEPERLRERVSTEAAAIVERNTPDL